MVKVLSLALGICVPALLATGCGDATALAEIPVGSNVTIETEDGRVISGTLADVSVSQVVVEAEEDGARHELDREEVASIRQEESLLEAVMPEPDYREVTIPAETIVVVELENTLTSNGNQSEDPVRARTIEPVVVGETVVVPAGSAVLGHVTAAEASGKVEGRARLSFRFTELETHGETYTAVTAPFAYRAEGTKTEDAKKIGIGAAAGAIIGGIAGGKKGAAVGSAIGGGAGTAVVLTTPGDDISLGAGSSLQLRLLEPLTVEVPRAET